MSASLSRSDRIRVCIMVALAGLSLATRLLAQQDVRFLSPGMQVKISASVPPLDRVRGVLVRAAPDTITVVIGGNSPDTLSIPLGVVTTLQARRRVGNQAGLGAGIGALSGVVIGLAAIGTKSCLRQPCSSPGAEFASTVVGNTVLGALIGLAVPRYHWDDVPFATGAPPLAIIAAPEGSGAGIRIALPAIR